MRRLSSKVLEIINKRNKPVKAFQIAQLLNIDQRSARYALKVLVDAELINKYFDLKDVRTHYFSRK